MSIILDVILITILAAFIFTAAKKGFMLTLLELLAVIVALGAISAYSSAVHPWKGTKFPLLPQPICTIDSGM